MNHHSTFPNEQCYLESPHPILFNKKAVSFRIIHTLSHFLSLKADFLSSITNKMSGERERTINHRNDSRFQETETTTQKGLTRKQEATSQS